MSLHKASGSLGQRKAKAEWTSLIIESQNILQSLLMELTLQLRYIHFSPLSAEGLLYPKTPFHPLPPLVIIPREQKDNSLSSIAKRPLLKRQHGCGSLGGAMRWPCPDPHAFLGWIWTRPLLWGPKQGGSDWPDQSFYNTCRTSACLSWKCRPREHLVNGGIFWLFCMSCKPGSHLFLSFLLLLYLGF